MKIMYEVGTRDTSEGAVEVCKTRCPVNRTAMIGSESCRECEYFKGIEKGKNVDCRFPEDGFPELMKRRDPMVAEVYEMQFLQGYADGFRDFCGAILDVILENRAAMSTMRIHGEFSFFLSCMKELLEKVSDQGLKITPKEAVEQVKALANDTFVFDATDSSNESLH